MNKIFLEYTPQGEIVVEKMIRGKVVPDQEVSEPGNKILSLDLSQAKSREERELFQEARLKHTEFEIDDVKKEIKPKPRGGKS